MKYHPLLVALVGLLQLCVGHQQWLLINKVPALLQGTVSQHHVVNNKLSHFMLSKSTILVPQQVLCPLECSASGVQT